MTVAATEEPSSYFTPDAWLAETLDRPVFKLTHLPTEGDEERLASEMAAFVQGSDAFFYGKIPTTNIRACTMLGRTHFAVIDTAITFAWSGPLRKVQTQVKVGLVQSNQHQAVVKIAETAFRWSRFHLDPQIPLALANLIKRRWIENYLSGRRGSALYVAESDGVVAGFLAVIESRMNGRTMGAIDLIGVAPGHQGRGIGSALIASFVSDWQGRVAELRVGTQAANIQSLQFYEGNGFRIIDSAYVLHAHCRKGEILQ